MSDVGRELVLNDPPARATIVVALTSTIAAVGAAAIPSAGLVTMLIVLQAGAYTRPLFSST